MQDWIPFSSALGACGIHASRATNDQVEQVAETVKSDPRLLTAFHVMGESMDFEKDSIQFNEKIAEILATDDANARMDIMTKIFIDVDDSSVEVAQVGVVKHQGARIGDLRVCTSRSAHLASAASRPR